MKVLVTGGAGYIGSHTVYLLIEQGHDVVVVDNLVTGHKQDVHPDAKFYYGNIGDYPLMVDILRKEKVDGLIHFAAYSLVGESMSQPFKYYENNVSATNVMLAAMAECGVKQLVFSSTAATYGDVNVPLITEEMPTHPTNPYGQTKLAMEQMIAWHGQAYGMRHVAFRYFNVAGAHSSGRIYEKHDPETHLIPLVLEVAAGVRKQIYIFGDDYATPDGTCIRDYIHVMDLAVAHVKAMNYLIDGGKSMTFNLGNGEGFSVRQVIEAAQKVTGREILTHVSDRRQGDPAKLIASSLLATETLNWIPQYPSIEAIIESAWKAAY
ncbi:MAG: UDP-glucose 4-epimerase GalE [Defluviitaleaceae bacterium]|nr:UDP-glucose 4-epimerase GalE [Defluviitaleaceae bacterium]